MNHLIVNVNGNNVELTGSIIARFMANVDFGRDNECWEWNKSVNTGGYGNFLVTTPEGKRVHLYPHRVSWTIFNKQIIPNELPVIRHKCDNPKCVNPHHLLLGTQEDNINDMKERQRRGSHRAFTKSDISFIRKTDLPTQQLAKLYDVHPVTINRVRKNHTYN